jgi:hypothetical protein
MMKYHGSSLPQPRLHPLMPGVLEAIPAAARGKITNIN